MKEGDGEEKGNDEKPRQHLLVIDAPNSEEKETGQQDYEFSGDHIGEDCADKESLFALEQGAAIGTVMTDVKWFSNN